MSAYESCKTDMTSHSQMLRPNHDLMSTKGIAYREVTSCPIHGTAGLQGYCNYGMGFNMCHIALRIGDQPSG